MRFLLCLLIGAVALGGCVPKLEKPTLSIVDVQLLRSDLLAQHMKVRMHVHNPNDRELPVKGLSYTLEVAGGELAEGVSSASFTVPARGDAEFDMDVTANMAGTLIRLFGKGGQARDQVDYRISGKVELSSGLMRSIPFDERGTFKLR